MPPIIQLADQLDLIPTKDFPHAQFPYENFNPVQSRTFEIYDKECNVIVAAATAAGKTTVAEMFMSYEVRKRGGKAMYLGPMKALAKEKIDDWTEATHHFGDRKVAICTGDFKLTDARRKELLAADIILMTPEMLSARIRNHRSEKNDWLFSIGTLVIDESHLLVVPSRGDHLEVALMQFTEIVPNCRIMALSATMPNVSEISEWISYTLTKRETYLINSTYRPCPLGIHYESYYNSGSYEEKEENKIEAALHIVADNPDDKYLVFVHTKRTGQMALKAFKTAGYNVEFHSADLDKDKRHKLEKDFKTGKLQILIATSTLAWGVNTPARRVIILGVHRGLSEVEDYDIRQMIGRSGRPGFDPRGDAYILLPDNDMDAWIDKLSKPQKITSRLLDFVGEPEKPHYKTLAFHLVSAIHHGDIKTKDDIHRWYGRSLAHFQANDLDDSIVDSTVDLLIKCGAIKLEDEEYKVTAVGKISSMFYYSPFDVADLKKNFNALFDGNHQDNDLFLSLSLGNVDTIRMGIVNKNEREEMGNYQNKLDKIFGKGKFMDPAVKGGYAYFSMLNSINSVFFGAMVRNLQFDSMRTIMVLNALDSMSCKWNKRSWFNKLQSRMSYGVGWELVELCQIAEVGKVRAEKLWSTGIRSVGDVVKNKDRLSKILNLKDDKIAEIVKSATAILFSK